MPDAAKGGFMFRALLVVVMVTALAGAEVLASYTFSSAEDVSSWSTSWAWGNDNAKEGTASWSSKFGGTAKLSISGAPGALDFWNSLPCNLEFGDRIVIRFSTETPLMNESDFDIVLGPATSAKHQQAISVSPDAAGSYSVDMPVYMPVFSTGTRFGIHFSVWPGSKIIYVRRVDIVRGD
jgi:hypothetical protein